MALESMETRLQELITSSSQSVEDAQDYQGKIMVELGEKIEMNQIALENKMDRDEIEGDRGDIKKLSQELRKIAEVLSNGPDLDKRLDKMKVILKGKVDRAELERWVIPVCHVSFARQVIWLCL
jgi:hypothetical protein